MVNINYQCILPNQFSLLIILLSQANFFSLSKNQLLFTIIHFFFFFWVEYVEKQKEKTNYNTLTILG